MSTIWYTSDLHLGHTRVAELRGFTTTGEHDARVLDNWRSVVREGDTVWVLGDLTVDVRKLDYVFGAIAGLPGVKHLIAGNHDGCHPLHHEAHKWQHRYLSAFASVQAFAVRKWAGSRFLLSHFPLDGDHTPGERYSAYRLRDCGVPVVHGHTHSADRVTRSAAGTRQVHVGLDAWSLMPVPEHVVTRLLSAEGS